MSWGEIKKAVNSDISTPLNTLISNLIRDFKSQFEIGRRTFTFYKADDTTMGIIFDNLNMTSQTSTTSSFTFTAQYNGDVRIYYSTTATNSSSYGCIIRVLENSTSIASIEVLNSKASDSGFYDVKVVAGGSYKFQYSNGYGRNSTISAEIRYTTVEEARLTVATVKRVQRGTFNFSSSATTATITLTGFTNTDKMTVVLSGGGSIYNDSNLYGVRGLAYVSSLNTKNLTIQCAQYTTSNSIYITGSYEVIEYY